MRRRSRLQVALALLAIALLLSQDGLSYGVVTHAAISSTAYQGALPTIQQNFFGALQIDPQQTFGPQTVAQAAGTGLGPFTAQGWIIDGSQAEDNGPLPTIVTQFGNARSLFHFFDPFNDRGLSNGPTALCGLPIPTLSSASDWGVFGVGSLGAYNDFPYASTDPTRDARMHFFNGITGSDPAVRSQELALMFRSLGQVIHLIQDMAQPQHVRNDAHLDLSDSAAAFLPCQAPSTYERYVDAHPNLQSLAGTPAKVTFELPQFFFANAAGSGLAQFTNSNFVSAGTNCTNTVTCNAVGGYPAPSMSGGPTNILYWQLNYPSLSTCQDASILGNFPLALCSSVVTFFNNQVLDSYAGTSSQNSRMTTYSLFDLDLLKNNLTPTFSLNHFNYDQQAALLIPKAVDYSAGLLSHFFLGSMTAQGGPSGFAITNNTMNGATRETIDGTFSLYYDDQNGNRQMVPGASWSLSMQGGATSSSLTFTPPTNPAPAQPGHYVLAFQGTMGTEGGAVSGAVVQLTDFRLTVSTSGTGSGTVTSSPAGVNCGSTCAASFAAGASVTLTAVPASGSVFSGWSGDCSGTGPCVATMNGDKAVTAGFTCIDPSLCGSGTRLRASIGLGTAHALLVDTGNGSSCLPDGSQGPPGPPLSTTYDLSGPGYGFPSNAFLVLPLIKLNGQWLSTSGTVITTIPALYGPETQTWTTTLSSNGTLTTTWNGSSVSSVNSAFTYSESGDYTIDLNTGNLVAQYVTTVTGLCPINTVVPGPTRGTYGSSSTLTITAVLPVTLTPVP